MIITENAANTFKK